MNKARLLSRVILVVFKAVRSVLVAAAGSLPSSNGLDKAPGAAGAQEGIPGPMGQAIACQEDLQVRDTGRPLLQPGCPWVISYG